jgi:hypothetical protein
MIELPLLPYSPPDGYWYEIEPFKRGLYRIMLCTDRKFDYNNGKVTRTIHSFYKEKTREFYSPVNPITLGKIVNINNTRPWTTMPIKTNPLMEAFQ